MKIGLDKFGTIGMFIITLFSPCCFPLLAYIFSIFGFGSFELFGGWTLWLFQLMVLISVLGMFISYRKHRCMYPLMVALPSSILIVYVSNFGKGTDGNLFLYLGMIGLLLATIWNHIRVKLNGNCNSCEPMEEGQVEQESILKCPNCGHQKLEIMPTDACTYFYDCEKCKTVLKPLEGDCCVYCSYGTVKCPPIQKGERCC